MEIGIILWLIGLVLLARKCKKWAATECPSDQDNIMGVAGLILMAVYVVMVPSDQWKLTVFIGTGLVLVVSAAIGYWKRPEPFRH